MRVKAFLLILSLMIAAIQLPAHAGYSLQNGKIVDAETMATMDAEGHYNAGLNAMNAEDWDEAARQFSIASYNFPNSPYGQEAFYYEGVAFYKMGEYDFANTSFSEYLKAKNHPRFFQETIEYKFSIAELFRMGARRRFLGTKQLPKLATGRTLAVKIYDEICAAVPCHEIAACSLYSKGFLLWSFHDYKGAVDCFQTIIRRFPKHQLAPECYCVINKVYCDQCEYEFQNPDILAFAYINLRRFQKDFPREERLAEAEADVLAVKEVYAKGLYETGQFYERIGKPNAACIYYQNAIKQFHDTQVAQYCMARLEYYGIEIPPDAPNPINENAAEAEEESNEEDNTASTNQGEATKIDWLE